MTKRHILWVALLCAFLQAGCGAAGVAQNPVTQGTRRPNVTKLTIPYFKTTFVFNGKTYTAKIAGEDPSMGASTVIGDEIIPVKLIFPDGTRLDGTRQVTSLLASPVFADASYSSGTTQFSDALMRAEFWTDAAQSNYHVLLARPTVEPTIDVHVPSGDGAIVNGEGQVSYQWFVQTVEPEILTELNIDPTTLSIFLTDRVEVLEQNGYCCFGGYHSSFTLTTPSGDATFTTAWSSARLGSVAGIAHEVTEALNDPFYTNVVPRWVNPVSNQCGGSKLEVGDPEAGADYIVNGYQVSDMTFFSWFSRNSPSVGINGQYDMLGLLSTPAPVCP